MKQLFLIIAVVISTIYTGTAQQFKWVKGGGAVDVSQGGTDEERVLNMCTDDNGNIYILSYINEYSIKADTFFKNKAIWASHNILFASYDCSGNMRFARFLESGQGSYAQGLAYDKGYVYLSAIMSYKPKRFDNDTTITALTYKSACLVKYDTLGKYKWSQFIGADALITINAGASDGSVSIDGQGNIHHFTTMGSGIQITSSITSTWGTYDLKYDPTGNLLSVNKLLGIDSNYVVSRSIIDKTTNKVYCTFKCIDCSLSLTGSIISAFNINGSQIWKDTVSLRCGIGNFRIKSGDGIYYVGGANGGGNTFSIGGKSITNTFNPVKAYAVIGKLDFNGNCKWMKIVGASNAIVGFGDLEVLPDYSIACVGVLSNTHKYGTDSLVSTPNEGQNPVYFNIDTSGLLIDWHELHGTGFYDMAYNVTSDKIGNVYIGGNLKTDMTAKGITTPYNSNGGDKDFFTMKYGYDCDCTAPAFPTASFNYIIVDSAARKVKFTYTGTSPKDSIIWQLGDGTIKKADTFTYQYSAVDTYTVCLRVNVHCGRKKICKDIIVPFKDGGGNSVALLLGNKNIEVYPNPTNEKLYINGAGNNTTLVLYDMMGKTVYKSMSTSDHETIDISSMANGNYILLLTDNNGNRASKRIVKQ